MIFWQILNFHKVAVIFIPLPAGYSNIVQQISTIIWNISTKIVETVRKQDECSRNHRVGRQFVLFVVLSFNRLALPLDHTTVTEIQIPPMFLNTVVHSDSSDKGADLLGAPAKPILNPSSEFSIYVTGFGFKKFDMLIRVRFGSG